MHDALGAGELRRQRGTVGDRRAIVRHVHHAGGAAGDGGRGLGAEVADVGGAGLPEVHLVVDHARQQVQPGSVDHGVGGAPGEVRAKCGDAAALGQQVGLEHPAFVDRGGVEDQEAVGHKPLIVPGGRVPLPA